jgi:hypothetical protein
MACTQSSAVWGGMAVLLSGGQRDVARCVALLKQAEGSAQDFFSVLILPIRQFLLNELL